MYFSLKSPLEPGLLLLYFEDCLGVCTLAMLSSFVGGAYWRLYGLPYLSGLFSAM